MIKNLLKNWIPKSWLHRYADVKNRNKSAEELFTEIYQKGYWGKGDEESSYFSGTGTHDQNTLKYVEMLSDFIEKHSIKSVFEIGCGDFSIMKKVLERSPVNYTGVDVVADLIEHLQSKEANRNANFIHLDAIESESYPEADLCVIRQVLQHLNNRQIAQILHKIKQFKYTIITEHLPVHPVEINGDKNLSGYIRLQNAKTSGVFLEAPPFSIKCETILSYPKNDADFKGNIIPALMLSSLVVND